MADHYCMKTYGEIQGKTPCFPRPLRLRIVFSYRPQSPVVLPHISIKKQKLLKARFGIVQPVHLSVIR
jgi:hypothetical protein